MSISWSTKNIMSLPFNMFTVAKKKFWSMIGWCRNYWSWFGGDIGLDKCGIFPILFCYPYQICLVYGIFFQLISLPYVSNWFWERAISILLKSNLLNSCGKVLWIIPCILINATILYMWRLSFFLFHFQFYL